MTSAQLIKVFLVSSDLTNADLSKANLDGADLRFAELDNTKLKGANLNDANLIGAKLNGGNLTDATLDGVKLGYLALPTWNNDTIDIYLNNINNNSTLLTTIDSINEKYHDRKIN